MNLCLFLPLGLLPGIQCRDGRDRRISLLLTTFFSLVLELVQAYIRGRDSSLRDLALNSMSAAFGITMVNLAGFNRERIRQRIQSAIEERGVLLLGILWATSQFFPFFPRLRLSVLAYALQIGLASSWISWTLVENAIIYWMLVCLIGCCPGPKAGLWASVLLLSLSPLSLFIEPGKESLTLLAWAAAGTLAGAACIAADKIPTNRLLAGLSLALIAYRQLEPFYWRQVRFHDFSWLPLLPEFEPARHAAIRTLALKCFFYWQAIRQLCLGWSLPAPRVVPTLAGLILLAEYAQQYQPSQTPELTDPLLCLTGIWPAWRLVKAYSEPLDNR
ncbi:MAG: VanZ family protein [Acidobacteriota bacterium]